MAGLTLTKAHGSRNEIFVVDGAPGDHFADGDLARAVALLCDRERGLGGDGVYFVADDGDGTAQAWFFNPDGSEALLCGNGMRCVGRLLLERHGAESALVHTGPYSFTVRDAGTSPHGVRQVGVELPPVDFAPELPLVAGADAPLVDRQLPAYHPSRPVTALAVPNSHLVSLVDTYDEDELVATGRRVAETPEVFPLGANVSFVLPLSRTGGSGSSAADGEIDEVFVRTYERGAGLTPSCGSGIVASRAVLSRLGGVSPERPVLVRNAGGVARSLLQQDGDTWQPVLEGNATLVSRTTLAPAALLGEGPLPPADETFPAEAAAFDELSSENVKALHGSGVRPALP